MQSYYVVFDVAASNGVRSAWLVASDEYYMNNEEALLDDLGVEMVNLSGERRVNALPHSARPIDPDVGLFATYGEDEPVNPRAHARRFDPDEHFDHRLSRASQSYNISRMYRTALAAAREAATRLHRDAV